MLQYLSNESSESTDVNDIESGYFFPQEVGTSSESED